jgi:hypothetical protein
MPSKGWIGGDRTSLTSSYRKITCRHDAHTSPLTRRVRGTPESPQHVWRRRMWVAVVVRGTPERCTAPERCAACAAPVARCAAPGTGRGVNRGTGLPLSGQGSLRRHPVHPICRTETRGSRKFGASRDPTRPDQVSVVWSTSLYYETSRLRDQ